MREYTFVVGIDSVVVVSMSDMSTFYRESLHENEKMKNNEKKTKKEKTKVPIGNVHNNKTPPLGTDGFPCI